MSMKPPHNTAFVLPEPSTNAPGWWLIVSLRASVGIENTKVTR